MTMGRREISGFVAKNRGSRFSISGQAPARTSALRLPPNFLRASSTSTTQPPSLAPHIHLLVDSNLSHELLAFFEFQAIFAKMPPTTIHSVPTLDSFTALADHQSQTPTSFYGAKPVLHYHGLDVRALISQSQVSKLPIFTSSSDQQSISSNVEAGEGSPEAPSKVEIVDAFVSSEYVMLS